ncbi:MAG TPA: hypothetical protein VHC22_01880 [Pirellulales bacterium]|nr:hypothetical protein [Pirellulales bacterium]
MYNLSALSQRRFAYSALLPFVLYHSIAFAEPPPQSSTPSPQLWAAALGHEINKSPSQLVKIPLIEFATNLARTDPHFNAPAVLDVITAADTAYQHQFSASPLSTSEARSALTSILTDIATKSVGPATIINNLGILLRQPSTSAELFQQNLAGQLAGTTNRLLKFDEPFPEYARLHILQDAAETAADNPGLRSVLDSYLAGIANDVKVMDTPTVLLGKLPEFAENDRIREAVAMLDEQGKLTNEAVATLRAQLATIQAGDLPKYHAELDAVFKYINTKKAQDAAAIKQRDIENFFSEAKSANYILTSLFGLVDKKAAATFGAASSAGIQLAQSIALYTGDKISTIALTADVFGAVSFIINLFSSGPSPEQQIMQQVQAVRQDIANLRQYLGVNFDHIETELGEIDRALNVGFATVFQDLGYLDVDIQDVQRFLGMVNYSINSISADMRTYELDASRRQLIDLLDLASERSSLRLPDELYSESMRKLKLWATMYASTDTETGVYSGGVTSAAGGNLLYSLIVARLRSRPLYDNVGFLGQVMQRLGYDDFQQAGQPVPNPATWAFSAGGYVELAGRQWPKTRGQESADETSLIISGGERFKNACQGLRSGTDGKRLFTAILGMNLAAAENMASVVASARDRYQSQMGDIDMWLDGDQNPNPKGVDPKTAFPVLKTMMSPMTKLGDPTKTPFAAKLMQEITKDGQYDVNQALDVPLRLETVIPNEFLLAERLGLGKLSVAYDINTSISSFLPNRRPSEYKRWWQVAVNFRSKQPDSFEGRVCTYRWTSQAIPVSPRPTVVGLGIGPPIAPIFSRWLDRGKASDEWNTAPSGSDNISRDTFIEKAGRDETARDTSLLLEQESLIMRPLFGRATLIAGTPSVERFLGGERLANQVKALVTKELLGKRQEFAAQLRDSLRSGQGDVFMAAEQVEAARLLLIAYLSLAFPASLSSNDDLRATLYGKGALLGESDLAGDEVVLHDPKLLPDMKSRVELCRTKIANLFEANGAMERHQFVEDALGRLRALKDSQSALSTVSPNAGPGSAQ